MRSGNSERQKKKKYYVMINEVITFFSGRVIKTLFSSENGFFT